MKKKIFIFTILFVVLTMPLTIFAYSNDNYEIELPSTFSENAVPNQFNDTTGNNINIQISTINDASEFQYSDEFLSTLTNELKNSIDSYKSDVKATLLEQYQNAYQGILSTEAIEDIINPLVDAIKYEDFLISEVSTFTKNNYPCLHYRSNLSFGEYNTYTDTYQLVSGTTAYTLTVSSKDLTFLDSQEIKDAVNSFTIKNYENYAFAPKTTNYLLFIILAVCIILVFIVIFFVKSKKTKKQSNEDNK